MNDIESLAKKVDYYKPLLERFVGGDSILYTSYHHGIGFFFRVRSNICSCYVTYVTDDSNKIRKEYEFPRGTFLFIKVGGGRYKAVFMDC